MIAFMKWCFPSYYTNQLPYKDHLPFHLESLSSALSISQPPPSLIYTPLFHLRNLNPFEVTASQPNEFCMFALFMIRYQFTVQIPCRCLHLPCMHVCMCVCACAPGVSCMNYTYSRCYRLLLSSTFKLYRDTLL